MCFIVSVPLIQGMEKEGLLTIKPVLNVSFTLIWVNKIVFSGMSIQKCGHYCITFFSFGCFSLKKYTTKTITVSDCIPRIKKLLVISFVFGFNILMKKTCKTQKFHKTKICHHYQKPPILSASAASRKTKHLFWKPKCF